MTDKYEALRKAAEKAGSGTWTAQGGTVFFDDGDSALRTANNPAVVFAAFENIGAWPDAIMQEDVAAFAAMANPSTILELLDELAALKVNADRYRWLRDDCGLVEWKSMTGSADYCLPSGRTLDVTIDATREQQQ